MAKYLALIYLACRPRPPQEVRFPIGIIPPNTSITALDPDERVDFAFQEASFEFRSLPFAIPYPVPFKLLGDEAKG